MGFNTIRVDLAVKYRSTTPLPSNFRSFTVFYDENRGAVNQWATIILPYDLDMSSNFSDANSTTHFNIIKNLLTQASIANLKVILVCGESFSDTIGDKKRIMWQTYDQQAAIDFASYMRKLASEINNYPSLLAYDFINEPIYQGMNADQYNHLIKKETICEYVKLWVDAVHDYDNNHLVTIGSSILDELFYFDPGIMKLDFYSPHLYTKGHPMYPNYGVTNDHGIQNGFDRFEIISYWMSQTYPMPWIIGETGFAADDNNVNPYFPQQLNNNPILHLPPYMFGSEQQQYDFAQHSLKTARNARASGFAWWAFQNVFWNDTLADKNQYQENFFGLLHYGDKITNTWYDKPAVSVFHSYLNAGQPPAIVPLAQPPQYYDPYEIADNCSTCELKKVQGKVIDQKGNNVENAVVNGSSWKYTYDPDKSFILLGYYNNDEDYFHDISYSFTDPDGTFNVIPYNYEQPDAIDPHRLVSLEITSIGGERLRVGPGWPYGEIQMANPGTITLKKIVNGYDAMAKNEIVNVQEVRNYYGRNTLTASNLDLNGSSNLTARKEININTEFHAHASIILNQVNETHIYISDAFTDCQQDYSTYQKMSNNLNQNYGNEDNSQTEIEIQFGIEEKLMIDIFPNPSLGIFNFTIQNPLHNGLQILVTNLLGETVLILNKNESKFSINFELLPKGIYFIQFNNKSQCITKKIILN